jgi:SAM-dependent methyltransferase
MVSNRYVLTHSVHQYERLVWYGEPASATHWNERWSHLHLTRLVEDARHHRQLLPAFLKYSAPGARVLEGGCGLGQWVSVLEGHGRIITGLDFATDTLRVTKSDTAFAGLPLVSGNVLSLPFKAATFDTYISLGVAEHFADGPEPVLHEARRVLRPGGYLTISVPHYSPLRQLQNKRGAYSVLCPEDLNTAAFYQFGFRIADFTALLEDCGFTVLETIPFSSRIGITSEFTSRTRSRNVRTGDVTERDGMIRKHSRSLAMRHHLTSLSKSLSRSILHSYPARRFSGHMVLYVAQSRT